MLASASPGLRRLDHQSDGELVALPEILKEDDRMQFAGTSVKRTE